MKMSLEIFYMESFSNNINQTKIETHLTAPRTAKGNISRSLLEGNNKSRQKRLHCFWARQKLREKKERVAAAAATGI